MNTSEWMDDFIDKKGEWKITQKHRDNIKRLTPTLYEELEKTAKERSNPSQFFSGNRTLGNGEELAKQEHEILQEFSTNGNLKENIEKKIENAKKNAKENIEKSPFLSTVVNEGMERAVEKYIAKHPSNKDGDITFAESDQHSSEASVEDFENYRKRMIDRNNDKKEVERRARIIDECLSSVGDFWNCEECEEWRTKMSAVYAEEGRRIMDVYNGILDKDVLLNKLYDIIASESKLAHGKISDVAHKNMRAVACNAVARMKAEDVLEWRNLMITRKGYSRLARMFSEFFSSRLCEQFFGTPLNIGCTYPKTWDKY